MTVGLRGTNELPFQSFNTADTVWPTGKSVPGFGEPISLVLIAKVEFKLLGQFDKVFSM